MISEEVTLGNYLRWRLRGKKILNYRRHPFITVVKNLTIHFGPIRWSRDPISMRRDNILRNSRHRFASYIKAHGKPDIIYHHGIFDYTYITRYLTAQFALPYWFKEHSSFIEKNHFPCANDFEAPDDLINFVQGAGRRFAASTFYTGKMGEIFGVPFEVMHNALNDAHFMRQPASASKRPFVFVNIALMTPAKNQQLIIRAFARAFGSPDDDIRLIIAGDGNLHEALETLSHDLTVSDRVSILNFQNRNEIQNLLTKSHVFILSSKLETFGVVLIEAMASGLPVISSRIPGPMDIVNEENGIFFEMGNTDGLAEAMKTMYANYERYDRQAICDAVKVRYGPDSAIQTLLDHPLFDG